MAPFDADADSRIICRCVPVSLGELRAATRRGCTSFDALRRETRCGSVCNTCVPTVLELLGEDVWVAADVVAIHVDDADVRSLELVPRSADYPPARPGQHIILEADVGGATLRRTYTISSARGSQRLRLTVKREPRGAFTGWLFDACKVGAALRITRPRGEFILDAAPGPAVCFVASIGVTPALALVATVRAEGRSDRVVVHCSSRVAARMPGLRELREAESACPNIVVHVRETARAGRLEFADVADVVAAEPGAQFYLCGPDGYLLDVAAHLRRAGVDDSRIHLEVFAPADGGAPPKQLHGSIDYMLVPPEPVPMPLPMRALRGVGTAIGRALNSRALAWQVGGVHLNPIHAAARWVGHRLGIDPAVPRIYLGALGVMSENQIEFLPRCFKRLEPLGAANRAHAAAAKQAGAPLPADTADGDTFAYGLPIPGLVEFPKSTAVHTIWTGTKAPKMLPIYVARGRAGIEHILRSAQHVDRGLLPYYIFQQILGRRDVTSCPTRQAGGIGSGSYRCNRTWAEDRSLSNELFGLPAVDKMSATMAAVLPAVCAEIDRALAAPDARPDQVHDLHVLTTKIAYMMIVWTVFGDVDFAEFHALGEELSAAMRRVFGYMTRIMMGNPLPDGWERDNLRMRAICREMIETLVDLDRRGLLDRRQRALPTVRLVLDSAARGELEHERLFSLFLPFIFGGHETTGHSLCWTLYEVARRPDVAARLVAEIDEFQAAHPGEPISIARYDERPITFAVLAETMRYQVLSGPLLRTALEAGTAPPDPDTGIGGFSYPAGALLMASPGGAHFDARRWSEPDEFSIDRFLVGTDPSQSLCERGRRVRQNIRDREDALDLLSFGAGPARCPGTFFNWHESILVLDALLSRYTFELEHPERDVRPSEHPLVGPETGMIGVRIRPRRRPATA
ncbi:cytochrome P450 [Nannocystis radixulma]|uniref:Cytochrome P450 n=1 Tax=Nannocystis radixulma TaxID=2995305 RepID=A0ABT5B2J0_9BACT|nr:cytochrome P450 [Nannocystis radixulma]MDC0667754.1 cytochrome P450 [Nannocystis radixulma]